MPRKSKKAKSGASISLSKAALVRAISTRTDVAEEDVREILEALAVVIAYHMMNAPAGGRAVVPGVAILRKRLAPARPARKGRDPRNGNTIIVAAKPARLEVKAKVDTALKDAVLGLSQSSS